MGGVTTLKGFSGNGFRIADRVLPGGALVWPEGAEDWNPPPLATLSPSHFVALDKVDPPIDLLILGTGAKLRRPAGALAAAMGGRGIGVEPMDSRAAARTYNLLAGEGRRVAAALYPLDA